MDRSIATDEEMDKGDEPRGLDEGALRAARKSISISASMPRHCIDDGAKRWTW